tara:strand:- start:192 stop:839 length:648 start_codon:yes stop_codon:yes gene_type:complete
MVEHYIHRGLAKKNFEENTIKAFKYSFKKKYGIETDLHATKDKQIVCFHDFTLKRKFKLNKKIKDINYFDLKKISKKRKAEIPLLKDLLKISKNKYPLLLQIKPLFKKENLLHLIKLTKNIKKYGLISFKEKNLINLYKINKKIPLGLLFLASASFKNIKIKSKKKHVKFLVLEKKFLPNKNLNLIKKKTYYYTVKNISLFKKYRHSKNLIFENL